MKLNQDELNIFLQQHKQWLQTNGRQGKQLRLEGAVLDQLDLSSADLRYAILKGASLIRSLLRSANLSHGDLRDTKLNYSHCENASFCDALMSSAILEGAFLGSSNFRRADLSKVNLQYSDCRDALFSSARIDSGFLNYANFSKCDFENCLFYGNETVGAIFAGAKIDPVVLHEAYEASCAEGGDSEGKAIKQRIRNQILNGAISDRKYAINLRKHIKRLTNFIILPLSGVGFLFWLTLSVADMILMVYRGVWISQIEFDFVNLIWISAGLGITGLLSLLVVSIVEKISISVINESTSD